MASATNNCALLLDFGKINSELYQYEAVRSIGLPPAKDLSQFAPSQGIFVTKRDGQGRPTEGFIRVLSDNPNQIVEVTGDFNNFGLSGRIKLNLDSDPRYVVGTIPLFHGMQYRLVFDGKEQIDPAGLVQSTPDFNQKMYGKNDQYLNSVFWDIEGVAKYTAKNQRGRGYF